MMVNRELLKSQIDMLPEEIIIGIEKYIKKQTDNNSEKSKRNAEYLAMLDQSRKEIEEGKGIVITTEQLEKWA